MTHDLLCPCESHKQPHIQHLNGVCHYCQCGTIAQVRADERKRVANYLRYDASGQGNVVMAAIAYAESIDAFRNQS